MKWLFSISEGNDTKWRTQSANVIQQLPEIDLVDEINNENSFSIIEMRPEMNRGSDYGGAYLRGPLGKRCSK